MGIKDLPLDQRPREKAMAFGLGALSDAELLALVIQTGSCGESALALAQRLLEEQGGLRGLSAARAPALKTRGISKAKSLKLCACFALAERLQRALVTGRPLEKPSQFAALIGESQGRRRTERPGALFLDRRKRLLRLVFFGQGVSDACFFKPTEVLAEGLASQARKAVLFHNHPSGNPRPSAKDLAATAYMRDLLHWAGIELLDHLILAGASFRSLRQAADLSFGPVRKPTAKLK